MIDRIVGGNIATLRRQRGISIMELASQCSLTTTELVECENGTLRPTPRQIFDLAGALNVVVDQLFEGAPGGRPVDFNAMLEARGTPGP
jgi:transcriptional regulator with XRE-family HTH domain